MEPMNGIEPATYALRKRALGEDLSDCNDSEVPTQTELNPSQILPKLAEKFRIFLRVARTACYANATQATAPESNQIDLENVRRKMTPP